MKKKLIVLSGITGVGKTDIAQQLARVLGGEIIVGDSLQIYKNFPIASNIPSNLPVKYHLLGERDVLASRLTAVNYKEMVSRKIEEIITCSKVPIIEGGSGFYLKYLLTGNDDLFEDPAWRAAEQKAKNIIESEKDWQRCVAKLRELCPSYDESIENNDYYRLEKAFKYALCSKGEIFRRNDESKAFLCNLYDIRGIFLTSDIINFQTKIYDRCDKMTENGILFEILEFWSKALNSGLAYEKVATPIGYSEGLNAIKELQKMIRNESHQKAFNIEMRKIIIDFSAKFQTKSRQYATYQKKYFRSKFRDFLWLDPTGVPSSQLLDEVLSIYNMNSDDFRATVNSEKNQKMILKKEDKSKTKTLNSLPLSKNHDAVMKEVSEKLIPMIRILSQNV